MKNFQNILLKQAYEKWLDIYHAGCDKFIPIENNKKKKKNEPWMTNELREWVKMKKDLCFKCRHTGFKQTGMVKLLN